ncbi:MAG TPA: hypothetical protein VHB79_37070 [Polyangiaceae bacterium]|nr:hypothetical protein [Polyangiaceae bacterium]
MSPLVLEYEAAPELGCASAAELRSAVAQQVGRDLFSDELATSGERLRVVVARTSSGLEGRLEWIDADGRSEGERRLASGSNDCAELASGLAFAVAVQLQLHVPEAAPVASQPVAQPSSAAAAPAPELPPAAARPANASRRMSLLGLGVAFEHGLTPGMGTGLHAFAATTKGWFWLEAGVQVTSPTSLELTDGSGFSANELSFSLLPCLRAAPLGVCAAARVGKLQVSGHGVDRALGPSSVFAAAGGQIELFWPALNSLGIMVHGELLSTLTPLDVMLNHTRVWSTAPLVAGFGLALPAIF